MDACAARGPSLVPEHTPKESLDDTWRWGGGGLEGGGEGGGRAVGGEGGEEGLGVGGGRADGGEGGGEGNETEPG